MSKSKPLVIVESPAKTRSLKNFLGGSYNVLASMGHVRDLPKYRLGIDVEHGFQPKYSVIRERKDVVQNLKRAAASAGEVFIASDPDREGEAIAWHLAEALGLKDARRIEFNEITHTAVREALHHPRDIDVNRVGAQQARRVLDRLVGYKISPLLCERVRRNLSAGRVQSVAVRLICDREREIQAFVAQEYWSIIAELTPVTEEHPFEARLIQIGSDKADVRNSEQAESIVGELNGAEYRVAKVARGERRRNPAAPFITSTLQQEASRKLGFTTSRTMSVAQSLYEGKDLPEEGPVGLITYLRTDSTRVSPEAVAEAREYIQRVYGPEYLPASPRTHRKSKSAQDAHEAIRPTRVAREPDSLRQFLTNDEYRLYRLIWQRFVASQMSPALYDVETVDIAAGRFTFRATGSTERFKGFRAVYFEGVDDAPAEMADEDRPPLPRLSRDDILRLLGLKPEQHFTEPPPRFTEASLVKALEEHGIGRPSTYASIISTIKSRGYVDLEQKRFTPTDLGFTVTDLLVKHFPQILDVRFTAGVESQLDEVENGHVAWNDLIREFYGPFEKALGDAHETMERVKSEPVETDKECPNCGRKMLLREGRYGPFLGCSGYPECKTIINVEPEGEASEEDLGACPECQKPLKRRVGRYGPFVACSAYPECRYILKEKKSVGVTCPECGKGEIVEKRGAKRGKIFYGCERYPDCKFVLWDRPTGEMCPQCSKPLVAKTTKARGSEIRCSDRDCGYSRPVADDSGAESRDD